MKIKIMKSTIKYNKKIANTSHNIEYYESQQFLINNREFIQKERDKIKTENKEKVTKKIEETIESFETEGVFKILKKIYDKNTNYAFYNGEKPINSNLLGLVSGIPLLMVAYEIVTKNLGSMTLASPASKKRYDELDPEQKIFTNQTDQGRDTINMNLIKETSKLIRKGKYPWGTSRTIYVDKPGKIGNKRPLTIPPFMDRVVQTAIKMVLIAIYEPYFDKANVSFGFRPGKSIQDAIYILTANNAAGLDTAIEGDIKLAYDKVNRKKLIKILAKKIRDRKFLEFIEKRLDVEDYCTESKEYTTSNEGIPKGGPDAPYLWNIYMMEFDEFITREIFAEIKNMNEKSLGKHVDKEILNSERKILSHKPLTVKKTLNWIRKKKSNKEKYLEDLKHLNLTPEGKSKHYDDTFARTMIGRKKMMKELDINNEKDELKFLTRIQCKLRLINDEINRKPYLNKNKKKYRIIYVRFADDWIILSNIKYARLELLKQKITVFLKKELDSTLSEEKTLITEIKKNPAHFLGFEIKSYKKRKIRKYVQKKRGKLIQGRAVTTGSKVFAAIDKQRIINRLHMKGYCDKNGFPREIPKLINLDTFTIIEKYNSLLTWISNCYTNFVKNPKTDLSRWIYIIRYSCIKTLAQKHKTTMRNIYIKFAPKKKNKNEENTIEAIVKIKVGDETWTKLWKLHTTQSLYKNSKDWKIFEYRKSIEKINENLSKGIPIQYTEKSLRINNSDYLEKINWVNLRTTSSFYLPCSICGSDEEIKIHHIKHAAKNRYNKINSEHTWEQVLGLKNRRQIPVCRSCHINVIHGGKNLNTFVPVKMYDNRVLVIESHIHKGDPDNKYKKTLAQKGWKKDK